jgi:aldose sugar dehydrogenase
MRAALIAVLSFLVSTGSIAVAYESEGQKFDFETLTQQDDVIWGFDFLPDGKILFTERRGALKIFDPKDKSVKAVSGAPAVWSNGQGGLLDVRVHPKDPTKIYLSYAQPVGKKNATPALGIGKLSGLELKNFKQILSAKEPSDEDIHFGSRIEFDGKGHIFATIGERNARKNVQNLAFHTGKIIRLNEDGSVPKDNPYVGKKDAQPEIWTMGHRSNQGLAMDFTTGQLWMAEMGPRGGDELNLVKREGNYGWPVVTYGREYYGPKIGEGTSKPGMEDPVAYWVPSISPSGIGFYTGSVFPKWKGNLFIATLSGQHLRRLVIENSKVVKQEELLKDLGLRFRHVRTGPDGMLYVSTDDGKISRLKPSTGAGTANTNKADRASCVFQSPPTLGSNTRMGSFTTHHP